jgi:hypothetical protein
LGNQPLWKLHHTSKPFFITIKKLGFSHYFPIIFPLFSHSFPTILPFFSNYFPTIFPLFSHSFPTIFPFFSNYFPILFSFLSRYFPNSFPILFSFSHYFPTIYLQFLRSSLPIFCRARIVLRLDGAQGGFEGRFHRRIADVQGLDPRR